MGCNKRNERKKALDPPYPQLYPLGQRGYDFLPRFWNRGRAQCLLTARSQVRDPRQYILFRAMIHHTELYTEYPMAQVPNMNFSKIFEKFLLHMAKILPVLRAFGLKMGFLGKFAHRGAQAARILKPLKNGRAHFKAGFWSCGDVGAHF